MSQLVILSWRKCCNYVIHELIKEVMMRESLMNRAHASAIVIRSALGWAAAALLGSTGILLMQIPGLSNMVAAQITAGTIGLIGGSSTVFLIRSSIGSVSWKQGL